MNQTLLCKNTEVESEKLNGPIKVVVVNCETDGPKLIHNCAGDSPLVKTTKCKIVQTTLDSILVYFLIRELSVSRTFRKSFISRIYNCFNYKNGSYFENIKFKILLVPPQKEFIDYKWSKRLMLLVQEKQELEHAMSWFSTLGGAFSALGDHFTNCADIAGKISYNQFLLALRIGDPLTVARCKLYLSLSLIQKGSFKLAKRLILSQYEIAKREKLIDYRLLKMCQGIWTKLKYEFSLKKQGKLLPKMLNTQINIVK